MQSLRQFSDGFDMEDHQVEGGSIKEFGDSNVVSVSAIFGVPFSSLNDIDVLTKDIEAGKYEAVFTGMTNDLHKAVMDMIFAKWEMCMAVMPNKPSTNVNAGTLNLDRHVVILSVSIASKEELIGLVNKIESGTPDDYVSIQDKPSSYLGATGRSTPEPSKTKANFHSLSSKNLREGVDSSIPRKVVEMNHPLKDIVPPTKEGNITMSNSYVALDDENEEDVENVYDESANLLNSTKIGGSLSTFTVVAG
ncbi:hypothetical protein Tco_0776785 [Tanacetum coccineum]